MAPHAAYADVTFEEFVGVESPDDGAPSIEPAPVVADASWPTAGNDPAAPADASAPEVYEMEFEEGFRLPPGTLKAWGLSFGVHIAALVLLAFFHVEVAEHFDTLISSQIEEREPEEAYKIETSNQEKIGANSNANMVSASQEAATVLGRNPVEQVEQVLESQFETPTPMSQPVVEPHRAQVLDRINTSGATEHPGGVEGAVDRLAWEIANSLKEKRTLVVWLFDVSPSLTARRNSIADRVENVYKQVTALNSQSDKVLRSSVVTFGEAHHLVTPKPVDDAQELVKVVRGIKSENSGNENVFSAVGYAATEFGTYRSNNRVMFVVVTDEAGSDAEKKTPQGHPQLDHAIHQCVRHGIRVYCVGDAAPLGRRDVEIPFQLESGESVIGVMQKGPETYYPDTLKLGFWGINAYDLDEVSSGFGPYGLTRLCAETNGLYFIASEGRGPQFSPQIMRGYAPDYHSVRELELDLRRSPAKQAVVNVAEQSKTDPIPIPQTTFRAENDTVLRQMITEAQRPLAEFDYKLDRLLKPFENTEKDRAKLSEPRWRAVYDLALGRLLAMRVRSYGYNKVLADMKANPKTFTNPTNNQWRLEPSPEITAGADVKKMAGKAQELLKRVIDEHQGTPWELLATRELSKPMGWEWKESHYTPPAMMANRGGDQKQGPKFIEEVDKKTGKKTKRAVPTGPAKRDI